MVMVPAPVLIGNLHHAVTDHCVLVGITFLELFHHYILSDFLIFHMHHSIMIIRIEFLAYRFNGLNPHPFK